MSKQSITNSVTKCSTSSGFPPQLELLKEELISISGALPMENPGSRWPKTTLGALKDDVRLTPDQLTQLTEICKSDPPIP